MMCSRTQLGNGTGKPGSILPAAITSYPPTTFFHLLTLFYLFETSWRERLSERHLFRNFFCSRVQDRIGNLPIDCSARLLFFFCSTYTFYY